MKKNITFSKAINEVSRYILKKDNNVFILGLGVDDHTGIWGTTIGLVEEFGKNRVFDTPISENAITGIAVGCAVTGLRPIHIHQRIDFSLMAMDAIFNHAVKIKQMTGYNETCPITIRTIIGKGWGQSVQHAQSFYPVFAHFPNVKVVAPYSPQDAWNCLYSSVYDDSPVIILESRALYDKKSDVKELTFEKNQTASPSILKEGKDITIIAYSYMLDEVLKATETLEKQGFSIEVLNPLYFKPLDEKFILESVNKTKRVVIVDMTWKHFNIANEISALVFEKCFNTIKQEPLRITLPDEYVGATPKHEDSYYIDSDQITTEILKWISKE